jgi:hypothetical protein
MKISFMTGTINQIVKAFKISICMGEEDLVEFYLEKAPWDIVYPFLTNSSTSNTISSFQIRKLRL